MSTPNLPRPRNTFLGKLIVGWRGMRAVFFPPALDIIDIGMTGTTLTCSITRDFDATPDEIWEAIWLNSVILPPHRSFDEIETGDVFSYYSDATTGRGLYWYKVAARCEEVVPGKLVAIQLISIDDTDDERVRQMRNEYIFEPDGSATRLTIELSDAQAGDEGLFKNVMAHSLKWDIERIAANLRITAAGGGSSGPGGANPERPSKSDRQASVRRA